MRPLKISKEQLKLMLTKIEEALPDSNGTYNLMEVCGTHTMAVGRSGIRQILPGNIRLISGPGCPVCVTHQGEIDNYLELAQKSNVIITTFGDLMRVPGSKPGRSLQQLKGEGADIRVVYSTLDSLQLAHDNPDKEVVFLGVGFETTIPTIAQSIIEAEERGITNYSVYSMHKLIPPALRALLTDQEVKIDGFIAPGHVSTIIGMAPYKIVADEFLKPCVLTGFEPFDILQAIIMLLQQLKDNRAEVEIQYKRAVVPEGNPIARAIIDKVFKEADSWWRGIGCIPASGLVIRPEYRQFDAQVKFDLPSAEQICQGVGDNSKDCACGEILKGIKLPKDCPAFKKACNPSQPIGPCMVSAEGACAAYYRYDLD
jgi:hydrogenase expression/formation protein HypD